MSITIKRRVRHYDEQDAMRESETEHPRFSHASMMWVAIGTTAAGIGANLYGQNKQEKAQKAADARNEAAVEKSDLNAWQGYLMQRGVNPSGVTQFGQIPTNAQAVNTRLPLWATMRRPAYSRPGGAATGGGRIRLTGTARG